MPQITKDATVPITIRTPPEIGMPLLKAATKAGHTIQAEILKRLAESLGVEIDPPRVGRPEKK